MTAELRLPIVDISPFNLAFNLFDVSIVCIWKWDKRKIMGASLPSICLTMMMIALIWDMTKKLADHNLSQFTWSRWSPTWGTSTSRAWSSTISNIGEYCQQFRWLNFVFVLLLVIFITSRMVDLNIAFPEWWTSSSMAASRWQLSSQALFWFHDILNVKMN